MGVGCDWRVLKIRQSEGFKTFTTNDKLNIIAMKHAKAELLYSLFQINGN